MKKFHKTATPPPPYCFYEILIQTKKARKCDIFRFATKARIYPIASSTSNICSTSTIYTVILHTNAFCSGSKYGILKL